MPQGQYYMHSSDLLEVHGRGFTSSPMDSVLPREIVTAGSLQELGTHYAAYCARLDATGKPYVAGVGKWVRCNARKIAGFDKATDRNGPLGLRLGNVEALPADKRI